MKDKKLIKKVKAHWNIQGLADELCDAAWSRTEPHRFDRTIWIGSIATMDEMAQDAFGDKEWARASKQGYTSELTDDYIEALAEVVSEKGLCTVMRIPKGKKEWRPESGPEEIPIGHVYGTFEDGEAYLGQYEEGVTTEELRKMGWKVED